MRITYDKEFKDQVLKLAGLRVGKDNYLFDSKSNLPIKDINGELVKYDQFGGIKKGSVDYIKSDLPSLIKLNRSLNR